MKLKSGEFETAIDEDGEFAISICQESNHSSDGGYTFEDVTNTFYIDKCDAKHLIDELEDYINNKK